MIDGIILDIDGVIVGQKEGFNFPSPHTDVLQKLKKIRAQGIPVVLCTAKPFYSVFDVITGANLNNPHIIDGGAITIDPIDNIIVEKHIIEKDLAKEIVETCIANNMYVELYAVDEYFVQQDQAGEITQKHQPILQKEPTIVTSLVDVLSKQDVVKIITILHDEEEKVRAISLLDVYKEKVSIFWGLHPSVLPLQFGIITKSGVSKKEGAGAVVRSLNLSFEHVLGIGDTTGDWSFMQLCGYVATVDNGTSELKELIKTKGNGKYYMGKSVDENGILDIFEFFKL